MRDETAPMLHVPDNKATWQAIARAVSSGSGYTSIVNELRALSINHLAANPGPEPEPIAAGDRLEAAYNDALYAIQALYESYAKDVK